MKVAAQVSISPAASCCNGFDHRLLLILVRGRAGLTVGPSSIGDGVHIRLVLSNAFCVREAVNIEGTG